MRKLNYKLIRIMGNVSSVKPWPICPPNSSQLELSSQSWVSFGYQLGLTLIKLTVSPNSSQFSHRLVISANASQLEPIFPPFGHLSQRKPTLAK